MKMQNEHLKLNLMDIQGNMAESVSASKSSLKKTHDVVDTLINLNEASNNTIH